MEIKAKNQVWDLIELLAGHTTIGCKWVYKTKKNAIENIKQYKVKLVAKSFTQKGGIDCHATFFSSF